MVEITQVPGLYYFENVLSDEECKVDSPSVDELRSLRTLH